MRFGAGSLLCLVLAQCHGSDVAATDAGPDGGICPLTVAQACASEACATTWDDAEARSTAAWCSSTYAVLWVDRKRCAELDAVVLQRRDTSRAFFYASDGRLVAIVSAGNGASRCEAGDGAFVAPKCDAPTRTDVCPTR